MVVDRSKLMESRRFEVGDVLGRSFAIWAKNFVPFGVICLVISVPILFLHVLAWGALTADMAVAYLSVIGLIGMSLGMVATGAVTYGVVMQMQGRPVSMARAVSVGLSRVFAALGVALTVLLMIVIPIVLLVFVSPALASVVGAAVAIVVGLMYWVAVPVAVVEKLGVGASLSRSAVLTSGSRGSIFLLLLVVGILGAVFNFALQAVLANLSGLMSLMVTTAVQAFFATALGAVVNAGGYQALRTSKEGVSVEDLAKVFD
jgi:hypothetical protein